MNVVGEGANAQVEEELNTLILDLEDNDPKYKRLKAIYKDCTDQNVRENQGWKPLEFFLDEIGIQKTDWKAKNDNDNWFDYIYKIRRIGGNENIHFLFSSNIFLTATSGNSMLPVKMSPSLSYCDNDWSPTGKLSFLAL